MNVVALPRVRIVWRFGSNLPPFVVGSLTGHAVFVAAILLIPTLTGGRSVPTIAPVVVDLVAAAPSSPEPASPEQARSAPPAPPSEPTEEVRAAVKEPTLDRTSKPPEPKAETKPRNREPQPAALSAAQL